jgi:hypothetical protein
MADEQPNKAAQDMITVAGGVDLEVAFQNNGSKAMVKVRQVPISKIPAFLLAMGDEAKLIELYCDKPSGWADTLTIESANEIANTGQDINRPFLDAWWRRQAKWREIQAAWVIAGTDASKKPATESRSANLPPQSPITTT